MEMGRGREHSLLTSAAAVLCDWRSAMGSQFVGLLFALVVLPSPTRELILGHAEYLFVKIQNSKQPEITGLMNILQLHQRFQEAQPS